MIKAKDIHHEREMQKDDTLVLLGYEDVNGRYWSLEAFNKECGRREDRLGRPDYTFENTVTACFARKLEE